MSNVHSQTGETLIFITFPPKEHLMTRVAQFEWLHFICMKRDEETYIIMCFLCIVPQVLAVVYSTCSSYLEENEEVVKGVLQQAKARSDQGGDPKQTIFRLAFVSVFCCAFCLCLYLWLAVGLSAFQDVCQTHFRQELKEIYWKTKVLFYVSKYCVCLREEIF